MADEKRFLIAIEGDDFEIRATGLDPLAVLTMAATFVEVTNTSPIAAAAADVKTTREQLQAAFAQLREGMSMSEQMDNLAREVAEMKDAVAVAVAKIVEITAQQIDAAGDRERSIALAGDLDATAKGLLAVVAPAPVDPA